MNIETYLRSVALTQTDFATRVGVSQGRVSQWIAGGCVPEEKAVAIEIATARAVTCEELRPDVSWQRDVDGNVTGYTVQVQQPQDHQKAA